MRPLVRSFVWFAAALCVWSASPSEPVTGVGNFHQVSQRIYRGAQPTPAGFASLARLGISVVLDLREPGGRSVQEERIVRGAGMRYVSIPMNSLAAPSPEDVDKALALLVDDSAGPVFVHCRRGSDRTGTVMACYRIAHDHWDNRKALNEARSFGLSLFEPGMRSFILGYRAP